MRDGISLHYKGCQIIAGVRDGRPIAFVHQDDKQLACFEGASIIDCANQAKQRIDELRRQDNRC